MLLRRELFKPLPFADHRLTTSAYKASGALSKVDVILEGRGYRPAESFRFLDEAEFRFFHSDEPEKGTWLVDSSSDRRAATPIRLDEALVHHQKQRKFVRLYVPRDVVTEAAAAIDELVRA
jgi:hypothetical protein